MFTSIRDIALLKYIFFTLPHHTHRCKTNFTVSVVLKGMRGFSEASVLLPLNLFRGPIFQWCKFMLSVVIHFTGMISFARKHTEHLCMDVFMCASGILLFFFFFCKTIDMVQMWMQVVVGAGVFIIVVEWHCKFRCGNTRECLENYFISAVICAFTGRKHTCNIKLLFWT